MRLNVLHLDDAFDEQIWFMDSCNRFGAQHVDLRRLGPKIRLWGRTSDLDELHAAMSTEVWGLQNGETLVTWLGSGDFHHVTALIVQYLAKSRRRPLTVVHFDNHPDWVKFRGGVHCGSWVSYLLRTGLADRVISVGVSSADLAWPEFKGADLSQLRSNRHLLLPLQPPISLVMRDYGNGQSHLSRRGQIDWKHALQKTGPENSAMLFEFIGSDPIYITIDKDVLTAEDAATNWDQGSLSLSEMSFHLSSLISDCEIIGIDVLGDYSRPHYDGPAIDRLCKRSEAFFDQPVQSLSAAAAGKLNEATNLKLLKTLGAGLC
jgi:hypothetical protein